MSVEEIAAQAVFNNPLLVKKAVLVQRRGSRDSTGRWTEGAPTSTGVVVVTAPLAGRERDLLPEGLREQDVRKFWLQGDMVTPIRVDDGDQADGDVLSFGGASFRAVKANDWQAFSEILAVKVQEA